MLTTIHITMCDRVPTITAGEDVISHNSDYVAEFVFDEEWQDKVKTVYFVCEDGSYQAVVMSGNSCDVPMMAGEHRRIFVGVQAGSAEKPSVLKTTRPCCLKVKDSIADYLGQPIPDPTPDVYEQIIAMLNNLTTPTWGAVQNKPFSTLGDGLEVDENGVLSVPEGGGGSANAVQYVAQLLTDEQKAQARENIGAKAATDKSAYIISKTRSYGYIHTMGMDFDGIYAQIQSGKVVMLLVDDSSTYYGVIHPASGAGKEIVFYNIADISDSGGRNKGIEYFGFTWRKGDDSLTEWWGDIPSVKVDETLTESGSAADAKAVGDALQDYVSEDVFDGALSGISQAINKKLDKNQGTTNAGKILGIGEDGNVIPQDKPSITVDSELSSTSVNPVQNKIVTAALAEKITAPTTAAVGQIIKVKSVDTSGKPTEWEAADLSSGGGEDWTLLAEQTTTEIVREISFTLPKSVKHVVSKIWCPATGAEAVNRYINVKVGASYLFYYIAPSIPDKSQTSQLTVSADSIGGGYWRLSYYANRAGKAFDLFDGNNQNESVAVGVAKATYTEANTFAIMTVATDTTQQFPAGTILKVWGF